MVVSKHAGNREAHDQGEWHHYCNDPDTGVPVRIRVRAVPGELIQRWRRQLGKERQVAQPVETPTGEVRNVMSPQVEFTLENAEELAYRTGIYALRDVENYTLEVADEEAAAFWKRSLKEEFAVGDTVTLDGKLTEHITRALFKSIDEALLPAVAAAAKQEGERRAKREERLSKT